MIKQNSDQIFTLFLVCLFLFGVMGLIPGCGILQKTAPEKSPQPELSEEAEVSPKVNPPEVINPRNIPETPREMRAAWVATVANIDWPSEPGLPVAKQKAELLAIMDRMVQLNMNAIILQVRPAADALYDSPYEPWSEFLTGKQGQAPNPYYDPLAFAIEEAHARGLELHAWFNPFRAFHYEADSDFAPSHIRNRKPELVVRYGRYWWLDPGREQAREYSLNVILDVARRYNIDGVHLDDYFYPYFEKNSRGKNIPFPDADSYQKYVKKYGPIKRGDWRRQNINRFVERLSKEIKKVKPNLLFGISPFGIWRPGHPPQIEGFDAYANLATDARKWFSEGWVDYLSPQLYWSIDHPPQSFPVLLEWWQQQNSLNRHLWPGLYTSRVGNTWDAREIGDQIQLSRKQKGAMGNIHFSVQALINNSGNIAEYLLKHQYAKPALIPATPWLSDARPPQPEASLEKIENYVAITLNPVRESMQWLWVLKVKYGDNWKIMINPGRLQRRTLPIENENGIFGGAVVSFVNKLGNESIPQMLLPVMMDAENPG